VLQAPAARAKKELAESEVAKGGWGGAMGRQKLWTKVLRCHFQAPAVH